MAFREAPSFPDILGYGVHGGPKFLTHLTVVKSGNEQRNQCWSQAIGVWALDVPSFDATQQAAFQRFFRSVAMGRTHGFRFRDPLPGEAVGTAEVLGSGDGTQTVFPLVKRYTLGGFAHVRTITKPVVGSVVPAVNGVDTGAFTIDTTTGLLTFTSAPASGTVVSASFAFEVPVRFDFDAQELTRAGWDFRLWASVRLVETRTIQ